MGKGWLLWPSRYERELIRKAGLDTDDWMIKKNKESQEYLVLWNRKDGTTVRIEK